LHFSKFSLEKGREERGASAKKRWKNPYATKQNLTPLWLRVKHVELDVIIVSSLISIPEVLLSSRTNI
jgi:hypothetical protein